ncbi:hypothetical protein QBC39DRAFT_358853 [Podospora conica]|nr:hypothetical protein QBC39DRAFT_358853 [Schizothecium conicum]
MSLVRLAPDVGLHANGKENTGAADGKMLTAIVSPLYCCKTCTGQRHAWSGGRHRAPTDPDPSDRHPCPRTGERMSRGEIKMRARARCLREATSLPPNNCTTIASTSPAPFTLPRAMCPSNSAELVCGNPISMYRANRRRKVTFCPQTKAGVLYLLFKHRDALPKRASDPVMPLPAHLADEFRTRCNMVFGGDFADIVYPWLDKLIVYILTRWAPLTGEVVDIDRSTGERVWNAAITSIHFGSPRKVGTWMASVLSAPSSSPAAYKSETAVPSSAAWETATMGLERSRWSDPLLSGSGSDAQSDVTVQAARPMLLAFKPVPKPKQNDLEQPQQRLSLPLPLRVPTATATAQPTNPFRATCVDAEPERPEPDMTVQQPRLVSLPL